MKECSLKFQVRAAESAAGRRLEQGAAPDAGTLDELDALRTEFDRWKALRMAFKSNESLLEHSVQECVRRENPLRAQGEKYL